MERPLERPILVDQFDAATLQDLLQAKSNMICHLKSGPIEPFNSGVEFVEQLDAFLYETDPEAIIEGARHRFWNGGCRKMIA